MEAGPGVCLPCPNPPASCCPSSAPIPKRGRWLTPEVKLCSIRDSTGNANEHSEKQVELRPQGTRGTLQNPFTFSVCLEIFIRC